jgi:hypothetical protein
MASCFKASMVMCWKMLVGRLEKTGFGIGICLVDCLSAAGTLWLSRAVRLKAFSELALSQLDSAYYSIILHIF